MNKQQSQYLFDYSWEKLIRFAVKDDFQQHDQALIHSFTYQHTYHNDALLKLREYLRSISCEHCYDYVLRKIMTFCIKYDVNKVFTLPNFEDEITVFRGGVKEDSPCWTLDEDQAYRFANMNEGDIFTRRVKRSDILAYTNLLNEQEIILDMKIFDK